MNAKLARKRSRQPRRGFTSGMATSTSGGEPTKMSWLERKIDGARETGFSQGFERGSAQTEQRYKEARQKMDEDRLQMKLRAANVMVDLVKSIDGVTQAFYRIVDSLNKD